MLEAIIPQVSYSIVAPRGFRFDLINPSIYSRGESRVHHTILRAAVASTSLEDLPAALCATLAEPPFRCGTHPFYMFSCPKFMDSNHFLILMTLGVRGKDYI